MHLLGHVARQTSIAGLSAKAVIAPWAIKGAMDGEAFAIYVSHVLVPLLDPGTVVILDNLATNTTMPLRPKPCAEPDAGCCHTTST